MCLTCAVPIQHGTGFVYCWDERLEWTGDTHSPIYMHTHMHACAYPCKHAHTYTHTHIHTHIHTHKHTHNYMHAHMGSMLLLFLNFWQSCFCQHSHPDEPLIQTARRRSSCCREISIFRLWSCEMLNPVCKSHFPCVQDSGFPEINHTAQFSWSSPPCTLILGERELPWPAWPWTDGHGDCGQQVSFFTWAAQP